MWDSVNLTIKDQKTPTDAKEEEKEEKDEEPAPSR